MNNRVRKSLGICLAMIISLLTLSGCMKVEANYDFIEGKVSGSIDMKMSPELFAFGQEKVDLSKLSKEELQQSCERMVKQEGETLPEGVKISSKVSEDGWLQCSSSFEKMDMEKALGKKQEQNGMKITYDEKEGTYTAELIKEKMKGEGGPSFDQIKQSGAEAKVNLSFGYLETVTVDGKELADGKEIDGIAREGNALKMDALKTNKDMKINVVARDKAPSDNTWMIIAGAVVVILVVAAVVIILLNTKKKVNNRNVNNPPSGNDVNYSGYGSTMPPRNMQNSAPRHSAQPPAPSSNPYNAPNQNPGTFNPQKPNIS